MATALSFIKRSFSIIGEHADETDIESSESNDALDMLNDMVIEWELLGANLGFAPVKDEADEVRIPRGAHKAVKYNLAVLIGAEFEIMVSNEIAVIADESKTAMMAIYKKPLEVHYPGTLPMGSGEQCNTDYTDDRFYSKVEKENF